jgi:hypothetical protein
LGIGNDHFRKVCVADMITSGIDLISGFIVIPQFSAVTFYNGLEQPYLYKILHSK